LWCQTCAKDVDAPSGRYRPGTDIAATAGLSRDPNECDHNTVHNLHGQCMSCGYTEPTEGDEPCDNPWCVDHEPEHTKAEHMDPPHLDPGHPDYQSAEKVINDALANHPDAWLLNHQGEGPSHLSSKTAQQVHHVTVYVHTGHQHARQTEAKPPIALCDDHLWKLRHDLDDVNQKMLDASDESNTQHRPIYGWRARDKQDGTCIACTRDSINDAFKTAHNEGTVPFEDWTGGHPFDGGSYAPSEGGKVVGDDRYADFLIDHHSNPAGHMEQDHGFAPEMVAGLSPERVLSLHESEHREHNRNPERTRQRERQGHGIEHEHSRFTPSTSAFKPKPRPLQMPLHPFTPHPDDPSQCVDCNNPRDNRHHDDTVQGHQPRLPGPLSFVRTAEWVHRPIYSGERITHTPGYPVKHPSGRTRLDVGDSLLWDSGKVSHIVGTTDTLLKLHDRAMPMHRSGVEGDHSKAIWHNDGVDDDLKNSINDIFKGSSRKTASEAKLPGGYLNEESQTDDFWAHPGPKAPYDPVMAHHGVEPKQEGHGPWHITRHPETRAYQLVDNQNRLVHSYSTPGHPSYERHDQNAESRAVNDWTAANQDHGHIPKWQDREGNEVPETGLSLRNHMGRGLILPGTEKARRKGEPLEDAQHVDTQHVQFHAPAPPFEHSTEDPRDEMYRNRARHQPAPRVLPPKIVTDTSSREHGTTYRRATPEEYDRPGAFHDPSPSDEYHGPYKVIQHAQTGKYHVADNQGRLTDFGGREGMEHQHTAEERRDYAEGRQRSKQVGRQIGEQIFNSTMDILDPGGTPESRQTERHTERLNDLGHRYEGGTHHPLTPGRFGADDHEHEGDGEGQPYYEVSHPSGYKARDYGGNNIHIYHAATGEMAHDLVGIHGGTEGDFFTKGEKPAGFGHEDLHRELHAWVQDHGADAEHHDPRIPRWQQRRGYTASKDDRFKGVSLDKDDDGFFVKTHRARSKSYPTAEDIPQKDVDFIESTGSKSAAKGDGEHWDIYGDGVDKEKYGPRPGEKFDEFRRRVGEPNSEGEYVPRKAVRTCAICHTREGTYPLGGYKKTDGSEWKMSDQACDVCTDRLYAQTEHPPRNWHLPHDTMHFTPLRQSMNARGETPRGEDPMQPTLWWRAPHSGWSVHVEHCEPSRDLREGYGAKVHQDVVLHHADTGARFNFKHAPSGENQPWEAGERRVDQYGVTHPRPPLHVLKHVNNAIAHTQQHAEHYADVFGQMAEQKDITDDLRRVPADMESERKAHEMFKRMMEKARDDDA
jgi:hypothetical protein